MTLGEMCWLKPGYHDILLLELKKVLPEALKNHLKDILYIHKPAYFVCFLKLLVHKWLGRKLTILDILVR